MKITKVCVAFTAIIVIGCGGSNTSVSPRVNYGSTDNSQNNQVYNYYGLNEQQLRDSLQSVEMALQMIRDSSSALRNTIVELSGQVVNLEKQARPRMISQEEKRELLESLMQFSQSSDSIAVSSPLGDGESAKYASQISAVLLEAGWRVSSGIGRSMITGSGVVILAPTSQNRDAVVLQQSFEKAGINLKGQIAPNMPRVQIFVGDK